MAVTRVGLRASAAALLALVGTPAFAADPTLDRRLSTFVAGKYQPLTVPVDWFDADPIAGAPTPVETGSSPALPLAVLESAAAWAEQQDSTALIVAHRGRVVLERYWHGDGRDTRFNPQSMAKTLVALLVGQAIQRGEIGSVDDPLDRYIAEWRNDPRGRITLRQALQMATGLGQIAGEYGYRVVPENPAVAQHFGADFLGPALKSPLKDAPGTKFDYNNNAVLLVAAVLERASGKPYRALLSERLWKPLGLGNASVYADKPGGTAMSSCCVFSRPVDWVRIGALIAKRGVWQDRPLVPAEWIDDMAKGSSAYSGYGYYLWIGDQRIGGAVDYKIGLIPWASESFAAPTVFLYGHGQQRVWVVPSRELVIVRAGRTWPKSWDETLLVNLVVRGMKL